MTSIARVGNLTQFHGLPIQLHLGGIAFHRINRILSGIVWSGSHFRPRTVPQHHRGRATASHGLLSAEVKLSGLGMGTVSLSVQNSDIVRRAGR